MNTSLVSLQQTIRDRSAELRRISLRTKRSLNADVIGNYRSTFRGSGLNFSELREYAPGDDIKHIDWRSSARSGKTYIKSFEEERQLTVMLAVDTSLSTLAGLRGSMLERALAFSSLLATLASVNNDLCGLMLFSDTVNLFLKPENKRSQAQKIVRALSESQSQSGTDIDQALRHIQTNIKRRCVLFVLSDFFSPSFDAQLKQISRKHDTILVVPSLSLEQCIPARGIVAVRDPETGARSLIDAGHQSTRQSLTKQLAQRQQQLQSLARNCRCDLLLLDDDPLRSLATLMQRRHLRGG